MTEQSTSRKGIRLVGLMVLAGLILSGCLGRPAEPQGASTARAEEELLSSVRASLLFLEGQQQGWGVPADPSQVQRLAGSYQNAALGGISVRREADGVVFEFGAWKSRMATRANPDGSTSFISIDPGVRGFEFHARASNGVYTRLRLSDPQHTYVFESRGE